MARLAARAGLTTILVDAVRPGAGASGGLLGALMPHAPAPWNAKKQFQFDALAAIAEEIARLEEETGHACGYRRLGRVLPLENGRQRRLAEARGEAAERHWRSAQGNWSWQLVDAPAARDWPDAATAPAGFVHETLSARVDPRRLVGALHAALDANPKATMRLQERVIAVDGRSGSVQLANGTRLAGSHVVVAAGHCSFALLAPLLPRQAMLGAPVKGQAALLGGLGDDAGETLPIVYRDGIYVVPHDNRRVAVGSTSERQFGSANGVDERLENVVAAARRLCPRLKDMPVVERWAGLRPRAIGRDPIVGPVPQQPRVVMMTGGFKITFGIAHHMAAAIVRGVTGKGWPVPDSFRVEWHWQRYRPPVSTGA